MTASKIRESVLSERIVWINGMLDQIKSLPLDSYENFSADRRNPAAAESYLRRAIEALMDTGRHVLAKGFGVNAPEYKAVAAGLFDTGVIDKAVSEKMIILAGYRNRMVHFYNEISTRELYTICSTRIDDLQSVLQAILGWVADHPDKIDRSI